MDFITLANAAHESSRHVLRMLATTAEDNDDSDDFAHLENIGGTHHHHEDVAGSTSSYTFAESTTAQTSNGIPQMENRPLLSPTAESVLLELSTNFLLYCSMVLITTMVAKIYFPSWLEPREEPQRMMSNHAYMNVLDSAYQSDFSDEDEEEEGEDDEDFEVGRYRDGTNNGSNTVSNKNKEDLDLLDAGGQKDDGDAPLRMSRSASSSFLFDYNQESKTKNSIYTNLALCAIMLNVTFVSWGLLQVCIFFCVRCSLIFDEYLYSSLNSHSPPTSYFNYRNECSHVAIPVLLENTSHTPTH